MQKTLKNLLLFQIIFLQNVTNFFVLKITRGMADSENDLTQMFVNGIISSIPYM